MPKTINLRDALEIAVEFERFGIEFYSNARDSATNPTSKLLFDVLGKQEHNHFVLFQDMLDEIGNKTLGNAEFTERMLNEASNLIFREELEKATETANPGKVMLIAMKIENRSINFYSTLQKSMKYPALLGLDRIIEEESDHLKKITEAYTKILGQAPPRL